MDKTIVDRTIVVTRHAALVALLRERGIVGDDVEVLSHIDSPDQIRGKHVIGILPLSLAAECASITEVTLALTPADRGVELGLERLREIAGAAVPYTVRRVV